MLLFFHSIFSLISSILKYSFLFKFDCGMEVNLRNPQKKKTFSLSFQQLKINKKKNYHVKNLRPVLVYSLSAFTVPNM